MRHREDTLAGWLPPLDAPQSKVDHHKNTQRQGVGEGQQSLKRNEERGRQYDAAGECGGLNRCAGSRVDADRWTRERD